ncbi:MAG: hypothetical protein ACRDAU_11685 [Clostridium sp.]
MKIKMQEQRVIFPRNILYFNELDINHNIKIQDEMNLVNKIISLKANILIGKCEIIRKIIRINDKNGNKEEVCKLSIELIVEEFIRYMSLKNGATLEVIRNKEIKNIFVTIPVNIHGENAIDLLRKRKVVIKPIIEDTYCTILNEKNINVNIATFINVDFI